MNINSNARKMLMVDQIDDDMKPIYDISETSKPIIGLPHEKYLNFSAGEDVVQVPVMYFSTEIPEEDVELFPSLKEEVKETMTEMYLGDMENKLIVNLLNEANLEEHIRMTTQLTKNDFYFIFDMFDQHDLWQSCQKLGDKLSVSMLTHPDLLPQIESIFGNVDKANMMLHNLKYKDYDFKCNICTDSQYMSKYKIYIAFKTNWVGVLVDQNHREVKENVVYVKIGDVINERKENVVYEKIGIAILNNYTVGKIVIT
jgi:hypothetical protein